MIYGVNLLVMLQAVPWGPYAPRGAAQEHGQLPALQHVCCWKTRGARSLLHSGQSGCHNRVIHISVWFFVSKGLVFVQSTPTELSLPQAPGPCRAPHSSRYGWFLWVRAGTAVTHCSHVSHGLGMCSPGTRYCFSACKELK